MFCSRPHCVLRCCVRATVQYEGNGRLTVAPDFTAPNSAVPYRIKSPNGTLFHYTLHHVSEDISFEEQVQEQAFARGQQFSLCDWAFCVHTCVCVCQCWLTCCSLPPPLIHCIATLHCIVSALWLLWSCLFQSGDSMLHKHCRRSLGFRLRNQHQAQWSVFPAFARSKKRMSRQTRARARLHSETSTFPQTLTHFLLHGWLQRYLIGVEIKATRAFGSGEFCVVAVADLRAGVDAECRCACRGRGRGSDGAAKDRQ